MSQSRQLAAIMPAWPVGRFTDIVGYTALMGHDEQHAFTLLNKNRQLQKPVIGELDIAFEYFDKAMDVHEGYIYGRNIFY